MRILKLAGRLSVGSLGCVIGTLFFGLLALLLPLADLTLPTLTLSGRPNRQSLAEENLRTFGLYSLSCALALFSFAKRDELDRIIR
jgi:hypothetical protein